MKKTTMTFGAVVALAALFGALVVPTGALPSGGSGELLVYNGNSVRNYVEYTKFAAATGHQLVVENGALPSDLDGYECVVLNMNILSADDRASLIGYAQGGGAVVAVGDSASFAGASLQSFNALASEAGSTIQIIPGASDPGYRPTGNIDGSTLTLGVTEVIYAYFSEVDPGAAGHSLFRNDAGDKTVVAAQQVGLGYLVVAGDSNGIGDFDGGGYDTHDNGALAANLCNSLIALGLPSL